MKKNNIKATAVCCFLTILFISCSNDSNQVKKVIWSDKSYGLFDYYVDNGDTIYNGDVSIFDSNGKLKRKGKLVKNQFYGLYKDYYPNGRVESIRFRKNDEDFGEITWYRADGTIKRYSFYDDLGNLNFTAKFDKEEVLETCEGLILFEIYQFKKKKQNEKMTYKLGDRIKYQFMFPNIPNTERDFHFELLDYDNSKINRVVKKVEPVILDIEEPAVKKGKNTIRAYVKYKFKDKRKVVLTDTISFSFYVK